MPLSTLSATEVIDRIRRGALTSEQYVAACIEKITSTDAQLGAWAWFDAQRALDQARAMDDLRRRGQPLGPLHGVAVGVKDIFDTRDMPTAWGTTVHKARIPATDSAVVEKLREAGAVIIGKTVTTEYAFMHPAATRNPHDITRTPGGSSSGSAAAVAAGHVPLAIGSQTNGSTIRPAAYCGVHGFKPTRGIISRRGALQTSYSLDQVGVFARSLQDVALLADVLGGYDAADGLSYLRARPQMHAGCMAEVPVEPNFAWFDLAFNDRLSAAAREGFEELRDSLGAQVERLAPPGAFAGIIECHQVVHEYEMYRDLHADIEPHGEQISDELRAMLKRAQGYGAARYQEAVEMIAAAEDYFAVFFRDYDAILTPAAPGQAPAFASGTGNPILCTIWTFSGLPCLSLPLLVGETGLPVGVQLVGAANADDRLLRSANWLIRHLREEETHDD